MKAALLGLLAGAGAMACAAPSLAQGRQECKHQPDLSQEECVIRARPNKASLPCNSDVKLMQAFKDAHLRSGMPYRDAINAATALSDKPGLSFRVVFRPADEDGKLLAMNPHSRSDVEVCKTHEVELYVGRVPYWTMPSKPLTGMSLSDAQKELLEQGRPNPKLCWVGAPVPNNVGVVLGQSPAPGALYGPRGKVSNFNMPVQEPLLLVKGSGEVAEKCAENVITRYVPVTGPTEFIEHVRVGPDGEGGSLAAVGAGALGAGLLLARLLGGRSNSPASGAPAEPAVRGSTPLPQTRVRPDVRDPGADSDR